ncbi:MAG: hypothetical protein WD971_02740 [Pirellulales bacterium]
MKHKPATDYWPSNARIIEFGVRDGVVGDQLVADGLQYLGVVDHERQAERLMARHPRIQSHLTVCRGPNRVRQNNADVLILDGGAAANLRRFRNFRHAKYVACPLRDGPLLLWTILFWLGQFLLLRLAWPRLVRVGTTRLISFRIRRPRPYTATRRFIPHPLGIEGFFAQLRAIGLQHAVLRWFESLPRIPVGEDLDLLVDDESLSAVHALLDSGPGLQAVDLYSVGGAPGADYQKLPYYPPYLAEQLLKRSVMHRDLCAVPSPRDHFLSLAYHALYHKGTASGLPANGQSKPTALRPEHDYASILDRLAERLGVDVPITLADLDAYLDREGWRPPHDMLVRLSRKNKWLRTLVKHAVEDETDAGLAVFLVRREALARGGVKRAAKLITEHGFQVIETITIDPLRLESIARSIRGGNWGQGPWPVSGGPPVAAIVAYDPAPLRPTRRQRRKFPYLANARLLRKDQIRDAFNAKDLASEHSNVIHSSDNGREARDYLRVIAPERVAEILASVRRPQRAQSRAA